MIKKTQKLYFLIFILFTGCTETVYQVLDTKIYKETFNNLFDSSKNYQDTLQYTQTADVTNEQHNTEALLNVTYLNPTSKDWDNTEIHSFIIGIYPVNGEEKDYKLVINDIENFIKIPITKEMNILGKIPLENKWATYYLVQVSKEEARKFNRDNLIIKLSHDIFSSSEIKFLSE